MSKVIVNGQEVTAGKKEKLTKHMKRTDVQALIKKKQQEQKDEESQGVQG